MPALNDLVALALPIVACTAAVWFWSFLTWAILPTHAKDWEHLPNEDAALNTLRSLNLTPGTYGFPKSSHGQRNDPAMIEKWKRGPSGILNIWPTNMKMGGKMIGSIIVYLCVSLIIGYLASETLPRGEKFMRVLQICGAAGVLAYCFAFLPGNIWFNAPKRAIVTNVFDGVVSGLITGLVFAALWPGVAVPAVPA